MGIAYWFEFHLSHIKCYSCSMCVTDTLSSEAQFLWIKFVPFFKKNSQIF